MALKERYQNPTVNDSIRLRSFVYNSNNFSNVSNIEKVDIYFLDPTLRSEANPDGRRLVESFDGSLVVAEDVGKYLLEINAVSPLYTIGNYIDVWTMAIDNVEPSSAIEYKFSIYPNLWYTTPIPVVYDFKFHFQPNKFRQGEVKYLIMEIIPNVPRGSDLCAYYENLAIVSDLKLSLQQQCGPCAPKEGDLRLILDEVSVDYREKKFGYYQLDTRELDCGIYDIWFTLEFGTNVYISDRQQLQIYN